VLFGLSYNTQLYLFRIGIWVIPFVLFFVTRKLCRELRSSELLEVEREVAEKEAEMHERRAGPQASPAETRG
jgi:hypothetical protein